MTVAELIDLLQDMPEDAEVRLAFQPEWPFEYHIGNVVCVDGLGDGEEDDEDDDADLPEGGSSIVFIGEGGQIGYLAGAVTKELGWKQPTTETTAASETKPQATETDAERLARED